MVTIELPDSVAAALSAQAEAVGLQLQEYLERMAGAAGSTLTLDEIDEIDRFIDEEASFGPSSRYSTADFARELDELSLNVPPLPSNFSRADLYRDHD